MHTHYTSRHHILYLYGKVVTFVTTLLRDWFNNFANIKTNIMGAPYGNKYAVGNHGGVKPKYETPAELQAQIEDYFEWIKGEVISEKMEVTPLGEIKVFEYAEGRKPEPPTITGLCLHCGFESRSAFDKQALRNEEFGYIVKMAKIRVEKRYENNLSGNNVAGSIFALKNMGWADNSKLDVTTDGEKIKQPIVRLPDGTELEL